MSSTPNLTTAEHFNKTAANYEAITGGATRELAQHAISLIAALKPLTSESKILDNACGTGIVTDVILQSGIQPEPEIHAVDFAESMVGITRGRFASSHPSVHAAVMPGEDLSFFPDDNFTHSVTNLGIMFFTDADKGAREIARTLRPDGVAVVTGWTVRAPFMIIQEVHARIRPGETPFKPPVADVWFEPDHTEAVLTGAGLDVLTSTTVDVHMGGETADAVAELLMQFGSKAFASWSEEEKEKVKEIVRERAVPFARSSGSGVGIKLTGSVFVARKGSGRV
jgi:ubiquinone/menaquinone biosynthesis C-methylase UbiE